MVSRRASESRSRFIPARAGNSRLIAAFTSGTSVYPRSRGEQYACLSSAPVPAGLSPLARGTVSSSRRVLITARFIPARAGNSRLIAAFTSGTSVYPRSRGEQYACLSSAPVPAGLSPLARGTVSSSRRVLITARFIPARAGNRLDIKNFKKYEPVYPRSRGEQDAELLCQPAVSGLSPLARGTARPAAGHRGGRRFIPARAGNRINAIAVTESLPVYPRSRGEQEYSALTTMAACGLSPLARGTDCTNIQYFWIARFIPARAGNSARISTPRPPAAVYPRSRGEQFHASNDTARRRGLSPLARGTVLVKAATDTA